MFPDIINKQETVNKWLWGRSSAKAVLEEKKKKTRKNTVIEVLHFLLAWPSNKAAGQEINAIRCQELSWKRCWWLFASNLSNKTTKHLEKKKNATFLSFLKEIDKTRTFSLSFNKKNFYLKKKTPNFIEMWRSLKVQLWREEGKGTLWGRSRALPSQSNTTNQNASVLGAWSSESGSWSGRDRRGLGKNHP